MMAAFLLSFGTVEEETRGGNCLMQVYQKTAIMYMCLFL